MNKATIFWIVASLVLGVFGETWGQDRYQRELQYKEILERFINSRLDEKGLTLGRGARNELDELISAGAAKLAIEEEALSQEEMEKVKANSQRLVDTIAEEVYPRLHVKRDDIEQVRFKICPLYPFC